MFCGHHVEQPTVRCMIWRLLGNVADMLTQPSSTCKKCHFRWNQCVRHRVSQCAKGHQQALARAVSVQVCACGHAGSGGHTQGGEGRAPAYDSYGRCACPWEGPHNWVGCHLCSECSFRPAAAGDAHGSFLHPLAMHVFMAASSNLTGLGGACRRILHDWPHGSIAADLRPG